MKSYGPKALIPLGNGETVISRQLRIMRASFPEASFTVVCGFDAERVRKALPDFVQTVENSEFATTNVARSIAIGLAQSQCRKALIVYSDLVFSANYLAGIDKLPSSVIVSLQSGREEEVGVNVVDQRVMCLSYGLPLKWAHMAVLDRNEQDLFMSLALDKRRSRFFAFEVINESIEKGGTFGAFQPLGCSLVEIDNSKDIPRACSIT
jgi:choline kinase